MRRNTVPFSVLRVAHPTIVGETIPLRRTLGTPEEEEVLASIGRKAYQSARRLRRVLASQTHPKKG